MGSLEQLFWQLLVKKIINIFQLSHTWNSLSVYCYKANHEQRYISLLNPVYLLWFNKVYIITGCVFELLQISQKVWNLVGFGIFYFRWNGVRGCLEEGHVCFHSARLLTWIIWFNLMAINMLQSPLLMPNTLQMKMVITFAWMRMAITTRLWCKQCHRCHAHLTTFGILCKAFFVMSPKSRRDLFSFRGSPKMHH